MCPDACCVCSVCVHSHTHNTTHTHTDYIGYPGGYKADGESPARKVKVSPFYLAQSETTNAQFREFVDATAFTSETEGFGFSFVFYQFLSQKQLDEIEKLSQSIVMLRSKVAEAQAVKQDAFAKVTEMRKTKVMLVHSNVISMSYQYV